MRLPNGQIQSMLWGLPDKSRQKETLMVGYALRHFSAVDVSVVGVRVTEVNISHRLRVSCGKSTQLIMHNVSWWGGAVYE